MTDPDFLTSMHRQFAAPRGEVISLVERATQQGVDDLRRLALGDENEVYQARVTGGSAVYVRIRRPGEGTFGPEVWAMQRADAAGVPVPRLLAVEEVASDAGPRSAMVIAESPGRQLEDVLPTLDSQQRLRVMANIGRTLALMHTIRTPGADRPDAEGTWLDAQHVREAFIAERTAQCSDLVAAGLTATEADAVQEQIGKSPDTPATVDPVLCHGDLHAGHIFVDDDLDVLGIIDWGLWHGGSAIDELATMSMAYEPADLDAMIDGHGTDLDEQELARRLAVSVINQAIGHIAWHQSIGNADGLTHYVGAVRRGLTMINTGPT